MAEQMTGAYNNPYKFNAKELDDETGLYYYGARYYNPRISIWYGMDPLAEKTPNWSPYAYAFDNPVRFVDPDGREGKDWIKKGTTWTYDAKITTVDQARAVGADAFAKNGSVISNTSIHGGEAGYVRLNVGGTAEYMPNNLSTALVNFSNEFLGGTVTNIIYESFPQITNNGGLARTDFDASSWDKLKIGDKLFNLDMGSFVQPGNIPGGNSLGERFSAFAEGIKNLSELGSVFQSQPDTLRVQAVFVYPEKDVPFRDTIFSEPYRKNESYKQVYDRLNKKYDSVKANSSKFLTR